MTIVVLYLLRSTIEEKRIWNNLKILILSLGFCRVKCEFLIHKNYKIVHF